MTSPDSFPTLTLTPSTRAAGEWNYLTPGAPWYADEWRGGSCAALVLPVDVDGVAWEAVVLVEGDLTLPRGGEEWEVYASRWDGEGGGLAVVTDADGNEGPVFTTPPLRAGDRFPYTPAIMDAVRTAVREGRTTLV